MGQEEPGCHLEGERKEGPSVKQSELFMAPSDGPQSENFFI